MQYTNQLQIPLALAVFLATDDYDHETGVISATSLLKPLRQLILPKRIDPKNINIDVSSLVSSRMGSAIHAAIERAWTNPEKALKALGFPPRVYDNIIINPTQEQLKSNPKAIPVYMEQRAYKELEGFRISGKYDFVAEGKVQDFKSTSSFKHMQVVKELGAVQKIMNMTEDECRLYYTNKYGSLV